MSATGVKTFSSAGQTVNRFTSEPLKPGEYELKIKAAKWGEAKAEGAGKLPYLNGPFEVLNTAESEGGKNRQLYHMMWTAAVAKEGKDSAAIALQDQIIALARALGEELEGVPLIVGVTQALTDKDGKSIGQRETDILSPKAMLQWMKNHDGAVFRARIKTKKGTNGYADKSVIDYFIEGEPTGEEAQEYDMDGQEAPAADDAGVNYDAGTGEAYDDAGGVEGGDLPESEPGTEPEADFEPIPTPTPNQRRAATPMNGGLPKGPPAHVVQPGQGARQAPRTSAPKTSTARPAGKPAGKVAPARRR